MNGPAKYELYPGGASGKAGSSESMTDMTANNFVAGGGSSNGYRIVPHGEDCQCKACKRKRSITCPHCDKSIEITGKAS